MTHPNATTIMIIASWIQRVNRVIWPNMTPRN